MAQPLFTLLKDQSPNAVIDVLAPAWTFPLLERMPEVRKGIGMPVGHGQLRLKERYHLAQQLKQEDYDQAFVLPNSLKSALIPFFAQIPKRTGWLGEMRYWLLNDHRRLDKQKYPLMVERFAALAFEKSASLPDTLPQSRLVLDKNQISKALERHPQCKKALETTKPVIAFCPGAEYGPAKRWPAKHFAELANRLSHQGFQVWIFGSEKESPIAANISRMCQGKVLDLTGKTQLSEAIDLLSLSAAVVTNDSGLMHMAAALDRPIVALYGSSDPGFTPPQSDKAAMLSLNLDCSPCFKRECPLGHFDCLEKLLPNQVEAALFQRLEAA